MVRVFRMIRHGTSTCNLPLKTTEILYSCFILVRSHQQCISIAPELGQKPGTNGFESDALAITLAGLILNGSTNIKRT